MNERRLHHQEKKVNGTTINCVSGERTGPVTHTSGGRHFIESMSCQFIRITFSPTDSPAEQHAVSPCPVTVTLSAAAGFVPVLPVAAASRPFSSLVRSYSAIHIPAPQWRRSLQPLLPLLSPDCCTICHRERKCDPIEGRRTCVKRMAGGEEAGERWKQRRAIDRMSDTRVPESRSGYQMQKIKTTKSTADDLLPASKHFPAINELPVLTGACSFLWYI